ncbi:type II toxin-antitoxin system HicA family toxin [Kribbella sp. NPDC050820]|uniref:type II toxin-antitoxin system HicA family toxin n=1 Tax=Kribbella sp. NPDC050820 TaxID=3155408 RepID=UPI0033E3C317
MPDGWKPKPYREVAKDLQNVGFDPVRQKGSHVVFRRDRRTVVVPNHGGKDLKPGTMRSIAKQAGVSPEDLFGTGKSGKRLELTPEQVNEGVANAQGAVSPFKAGGRSGGRRGTSRRGRDRDERSRR